MSKYDDMDVYDDDDDCEDDDEWDYCYECSGYGNNYYEDEDGELVWHCPKCIMNPNLDWYEYDDDWGYDDWS